MTAPKINLSEVSGQIKVITGEGDDMTAPKINLSEVSGQIVAITGEGDDMSAPKINLSDVFAALDELISGEPPPGGREALASPAISLSDTKVHTDSNLTTAGNSAHGLSAFTATAPQSLGTATVGVSNSPSRSDHVHPKPTPADIGALAAGTYDRTSSVLTGANVFSDLTIVDGLVTASATRALTAANIGITMGGIPAALADIASAGSGSAVALSNHVHVKPTYAPEDIGITIGGPPAALADIASAGSGYAVALSNHVHVKPTYTPADIGASVAGTYDYNTALTGANVFSNLTITDGLVTALATRALTPANIGALSLNEETLATRQGPLRINDTLYMGNSSFGGANLGLATSAVDLTNAIYGFVGDINTGMTRISDGAIGFMSNGSIYAKITTSAAFAPGILGTGSLGVSGNYWPKGYIEEFFSLYPSHTGSDIRIKKDITESDLGLDFILSLHPVKYKLKLETDLNTPFHYGLIAQELKELLPEKGFGGYKYNEKEDSYFIGYTEFIAPIITAMQEEHKTILSLEKRITDLEAIILELRNERNSFPKSCK